MTKKTKISCLLHWVGRCFLPLEQIQNIIDSDQKKNFMISLFKPIGQKTQL